MISITLSMVVTDYDIYDNSTPVTVSLTERQAQILMSLALFAYSRSVWEDMSDAQWETISGTVAEGLNALLIP